jgi:hypothetical protein
MSNPFQGWPVAPPEARPRKIFVLNVSPSRAEVEELEAKGYVLVDIRAIENKIDAVEGHLWGIHEGTIEGDPKSFKFIELLCKVLKMTRH